MKRFRFRSNGLVVISALKFVHITTLCCLAPCAWSPRVSDPHRRVVLRRARVAGHRLAIAAVALPWLGRPSRTARSPVHSTPDRPTTVAVAGGASASTPAPRHHRCRHRRITTLRAYSYAALLACLDAVSMWPYRRHLAIDGTTACGPRRSRACMSVS